MSDAIIIKLKLKEDFFSEQVSDFLFSIVEEGCRRRIAIIFPYNEYIKSYKNDGYLSLVDSFSRELGNPLFGHDEDEEVMEYRPEPIIDRFKNLQGLFLFILNNDLIELIEVYFTLDYLIEDLEEIEMDIADFPYVMPPILREVSEYHLKIVWKPKHTIN